MRKEDVGIYNRIDDVLWFDWDPIGVNDSFPRDEYQSYTPAIFRLRIENANLKSIANQLYDFEINSMGISGGKERCERVAKKILEIKI